MWDSGDIPYMCKKSNTVEGLRVARWRMQQFRVFRQVGPGFWIICQAGA